MKVITETQIHETVNKNDLMNAPMKKLQEARDQYKLNKGESKYEKIFPGFFERKRTNFVKKKTGLGGGFYPIFPKKNLEKQQLVNRNENTDVKKLKEFILKTKKELKKNEQLSLLNEEQVKEKNTKTFNNELPKGTEVLKRNDSKESISDLQIITENYKNDQNIIENNENFEQSLSFKTNNNEIPFENEKEFEQKQTESLQEIEKKQTESFQEIEQKQIDSHKEIEQKIIESLKESLIKIKPASQILEEKDELFQEEVNLQGDEALAPILKKKTDENIKALMPPSKKEFFQPQKYQAPQNNTIFDLSIKESIENISKETEGKPIPDRRISTLFENIEFVPSLNDINLGDFENNLTKEVIVELNEDIQFSINMDGFKEVIDEKVEKDDEEGKKNGRKVKSFIKRSPNINEEKKQMGKISMILEQDMKGEEEKTKKNDESVIHSSLGENKENLMNFIGNNMQMNGAEDDEEENKKTSEIDQENMKLSNREIDRKIDVEIPQKNDEEEEEINKEIKTKINPTMKINTNIKEELNTENPKERYVEKIKVLDKEINKEIKKTMSIVEIKNELNKSLNQEINVSMEKLNSFIKISNNSIALNKEKNKEMNRSNEINIETNNELNKSSGMYKKIKNERNKEMAKEINKEITAEIFQNKTNKKIMKKIDKEIKENIDNNFQISEKFDDDDLDFFTKNTNTEDKFKKSSNGINFNNYQIKLNDLLENHPKKIFSTSKNCEEIDFVDPFPQRPFKNSKKIDKNFPETWKKALFSLENSDFDEAFSEILSTGLLFYIFNTFLNESIN